MRSLRRPSVVPSAGCEERRFFAAALAIALSIALASCSSVSFVRESESSGTFVSTGWSFTLFSVDLPKSALNIARENASDANLPNTVVREVTVGPYLGALDFLLEIISVRHARLEGTWGFSGEEARDRDDFRLD